MPFAMYMLEDETFFWWELVENLLLSNGEEPILWGAFWETFYDKYFPEPVHHKEAEFLELTQGSMSVAAYETKFTELAHFAPHIIIDEPTRARKLLCGLRPWIRTRLTPFLLTQYSDVVNRVLVVEQDNDDYRKVHEHRKHPLPFDAPKGL